MPFRTTPSAPLRARPRGIGLDRVTTRDLPAWTTQIAVPPSEKRCENRILALYRPSATSVTPSHTVSVTTTPILGLK